MFLKKMLIDTLNNFFSSNLSSISSSKACTFSLINSAVTINCRTCVLQLIVFDFESHLIFRVASFLNKCFRSVTLLLTLSTIIIINLWTRSYRCKTFNTASTSLSSVFRLKRNLNEIRISRYRDSMSIKYVVILKNAKWLENFQTFNAKNILILSFRFWNTVSRISFARCFTSSSKKIRRKYQHSTSKNRRRRRIWAIDR